MAQLVTAQAGVNLDSLLISPLTGGASQINIYGAVNGSSVYRPNALTGDPNHLGIMLIVPLLVLMPMYLRLEAGHRLKRKLGALIGFMLVVEIATLSRSGLLGLGVGALVLLLPYRGYLRSRALIAPVAGALAVLAIVIVSRFHFFLVVIRSRIQTGRASQSAHFQVYSFIPKILHSHPLLGLGLNNFSIYYQQVTGKTNWGPHSFYVSLIVETGLVGTVALRVLPALGVLAARGRPAGRERARPRRQPARGEGAAPRLGLDGGARRDARSELLLPDDAVLLRLRLPGARRSRCRSSSGRRSRPAVPRAPCRRPRSRPRARRPRLRVCVVTTSYPRSPGDVAGAFVAAQVEALRAAGVEVDVVSPADFPSFGIAYGDGIAQNLRARPWLVALLPLFLVLFARAARRASRRADVVHAHWLPSALPALATGKPLVVQVWGTDLELARRMPRLARPLVRRAQVVVAASGFLADGARALGARSVRVIPNGLELPAELGEPEEPPHLLYVGRLSEEKGILELLEATAWAAAGRRRGRAAARPGPRCSRVRPHRRSSAPTTRAPPSSACPRGARGTGSSRARRWPTAARSSRRSVGGLADAVEDGVTGLLVPPRNAGALRAALERLLADETLRSQLGANARRVAEETYSWPVATESLLSAYAEASRRTT